MKRIAVAVAVCVAAGLFAPAARADDEVALPFHVPCNKFCEAEPEPENYYKIRSKRYGNTNAAALGYVGVGASVAVVLVVLYVRDTRSQFGPRRKQAWDR